MAIKNRILNINIPKSNKNLRFIICLELAILFYTCLVPFLHELGHLLFGLIIGMKFREFKITIPLGTGTSYMSMTGGIVKYYELFLMGGVLFTYLFAIIFFFIYMLKNNIIFLSLGIGLYLDSLLYPPISILIEAGDFFMITEIALIYWIIITILFLNFLLIFKQNEVNLKKC